MVRQAPELIEQEMHATRQALTAKVAALENKVLGTVQQTTDAVQDTVHTVKTAVQDTVGTVQHSMETSILSAAHTMQQVLDLPSRVQSRPWTMVGGAALVGLLTGLFAFRGEREHPKTVRSTKDKSTSGAWFDEVLDRVGQELKTISETAIASASEALQENLNQDIPKLVQTVFAKAEEPSEYVSAPIHSGNPSNQQSCSTGS